MFRKASQFINTCSSNGVTIPIVLVGQSVSALHNTAIISLILTVEFWGWSRNEEVGEAMLKVKMMSFEVSE